MSYALIIEDDPDAADVARGMLHSMGYEADIAADGHGALYALSERPPDLILLDICLPQMDGVTLMKVARKVRETQKTPVVACSAVYPPDSAVAKVLRDLGVQSYLSKPFNLAALRSAVKMAHPTGPAGRAAANKATKPAAHRPLTRAEGVPAVTSGDVAASASAADETATLVLRLEDVVARVRVGVREVPMLVERASEASLALRCAEDVLTKGDEVRASVKIRRAVNDAMKEFDIRIMGTIEDKQASPRGHRYTIKPRLVNPTYGLKLIAEDLARQ